MVTYSMYTYTTQMITYILYTDWISFTYSMLSDGCLVTCHDISNGTNYTIRSLYTNVFIRKKHASLKIVSFY